LPLRYLHVYEKDLKMFFMRRQMIQIPMILLICYLSGCQTMTDSPAPVMSNEHIMKNTLADYDVKAGDLLYESTMNSQLSIKGWSMEGPGVLEFSDGWMTMSSPSQKAHHVFWCPETFPASYIAQWEMQNKNLEAGLCIVFFSATGLNENQKENQKGSGFGIRC